MTTLYLVDNSVFQRLPHQPQVADALRAFVTRGLFATCLPITLEAGHSANQRQAARPRHRADQRSSAAPGPRTGRSPPSVTSPARWVSSVSVGTVSGWTS